MVALFHLVRYPSFRRRLNHNHLVHRAEPPKTQTKRKKQEREMRKSRDLQDPAAIGEKLDRRKMSRFGYFVSFDKTENNNCFVNSIF
ncbi:hypothetical protein CARUB_v10024422mg [Capsella rubella]|uniref:Uncharacterized protein n=1 Tax=Capsella rubella TaxID=81985 RepID=R0HS95_9BRAS|nr:hypothetical protein CARUB_v10024422mg [Capsella rubella]